MTSADVFERSLGPLPRSARAMVLRAIDADELDQLFGEHTESQRQRDLLFSTMAQLMLLVVTRSRPSIRSAYQDDLPHVSTSLTAIYAKMLNVESGLCRAWVRHSFGRLSEAFEKLKVARRPEPIAGLRCKALDDNQWAIAQHQRLKPTRGEGAESPPSPCVVVLDSATRLASDAVFQTEGQELESDVWPEVFAQVEPKDLWIGGRDYAAGPFLFGVADKGGHFLVRRQDQELPLTESAPWPKGTWTESGTVREQRVEVVRLTKKGKEPRGSRGGPPRMSLRRVRLDLDEPLESGDGAIELLSNVPDGAATADQLAQTYLRRFRTGRLFWSLAEAFEGEPQTLAYPRAASFGFATALVAANLVTASAAARPAPKAPR